MTTTALAPNSEVAQWRQRVFRVSSLCEIFFGSVWIANAIRPTLPIAGAVVVFLTGLGACAISIRTTRGVGACPNGAAARMLERRITAASIAQLAVAIVLPVGLVAVGLGEWAMPVVVASVGLLFVWLDREVQLARLRRLGTALVALPIAATLALPGSAQAPCLLAVAGAAMVVTGLAGVRSIAIDQLNSSPRNGTD